MLASDIVLGAASVSLVAALIAQIAHMARRERPHHVSPSRDVAWGWVACSLIGFTGAFCWGVARLHSHTLSLAFAGLVLSVCLVVYKYSHIRRGPLLLTREQTTDHTDAQ